MRIAVAANDNQGLEGAISAHFGRCPYYFLADVAKGKIGVTKVVGNPFYSSHGNSGEVPNFIHSQGVNVMIAGGMGPKAINFFQELEIEVVTGARGRVGEAISSYLGGRLSGSQSCHEGDERQASRTHPDREFWEPKDEVVALQQQLAAMKEKLARLSEQKEIKKE